MASVAGDISSMQKLLHINGKNYWTISVLTTFLSIFSLIEEYFYACYDANPVACVSFKARPQRSHPALVKRCW